MAAFLSWAGGIAGPLGATVPTDPASLTDEIRRSLPERVVVDRLVTTPHHVVLGGHAPDLGEVAELVDALYRVLPFEEPQVRRVERSERGFDFSVTAPLFPVEPRDEPSSPWSPYEPDPIQEAVGWLFISRFGMPPDPSQRSDVAPAASPKVEPPGSEGAPELGDSAIREFAVRDPFLDMTGFPKPVGDGSQSEIEALLEMLGGSSAEDRDLLPSALSELTCQDLTEFDVERLGEMLEQAELRFALYRWERRRAEENLEDGERPGVQRYLGDIAQTMAFDLARRFGREPGHRGPAAPLASILEVERPPPVEMVSLLGDLELIAGRPSAAVEAYRQARILSPDYEPLCGRLHDGKLYGAETYIRWDDRVFDTPILTSHLLAWDPETGRVLERHLLPGLPEAFQAEGDALRISLTGAGSVRILRSRLDPPVQLTNWSSRFQAIQSGKRLVSNFARLERATWTWVPFEVGPEIVDRLPVTPEELEQALRAATIQDPTRPWHPFWLGQALWVQGRHDEAEAVWSDLWQNGLSSLPFNELAAMAGYHEVYGQRDRAVRVFDLAVEERRRLSPSAEKQIYRWLDAGSWVTSRLSGDPERLYFWWRRVREISTDSPGDLFAAALWADYFARRGDRVREGEALEILQRERGEIPEILLAIVYFDISLYLLAGVVAMIFARSTILAGRLRWRRLLRRPRWLGSRRLRGLDLLALVLALQIALSLTVFTASYSGYLYTLDEAESAMEQRGMDTDLRRLTRGDLVWAWLTQGFVEPAAGSPAPMVSALQRLRSRGLDYRVSVVLPATLALFVLALPFGQLLRWGRLRRLVTIAVPGASHVRAGTRLRGLIILGLFVFAGLGLTWLGVARAHAEPAPGLVSAEQSLFFSPWTPPPPEGSSSHAASFWRLLTIYPGTGLFWTLVFAALVVSVVSHVEAVMQARQGAPPSPKRGAALSGT